MSVVSNIEIGIRVKISGPNIFAIDEAVEDIRREVQRVAHRKVLERRYGIKQPTRYSAFVSELRSRDYD